MSSPPVEDKATQDLPASTEASYARDGSVYLDPRSLGHAIQKNGNRGFSAPKKHLFKNPVAEGNSTQENGDVGRTSRETSNGNIKEVCHVDIIPYKIPQLRRSDSVPRLPDNLMETRFKARSQLTLRKCNKMQVKMLVFDFDLRLRLKDFLCGDSAAFCALIGFKSFLK